MKKYTVIKKPTITPYKKIKNREKNEKINFIEKKTKISMEIS